MQSKMQNWLVVRYGIAVIIQHQGSKISLVSKDDMADLKKFPVFYLVGITKEFVNWHLESREHGIYQNTIPNMGNNTKECRVGSKNIENYI